MNSKKNLKFFIVDDDPFFRMLFHQHLSNIGFKNNVLLENGVDCINKLELQPDVIFLDYDMEPINGMDVLRSIKKINPFIQVLMISCRNEEQIIAEARQLGVYDYIVKGEHDIEMITKAVYKIAGKRENDVLPTLVLI